MVEQFWGRAVRASHDSKELWGASYFLRTILSTLTTCLHLI